jgi:hypothetical protein
MSDKEPLEYFTGSHNDYLEIATRGKETMGLSLVYAIHPVNGIGAVLARFVVYAPKTHNVGKFTQLTPREEAAFKKDGHQFVGTRLNREIIPLFSPGPTPLKMLSLCDKYVFWDILHDWVNERVKAEGFTWKPGVNKDSLRDLMGGNYGTDDGYKLLMEFPTFGETPVASTTNEPPPPPSAQGDGDGGATNA